MRTSAPRSVAAVPEPAPAPEPVQAPVAPAPAPRRARRAHLPKTQDPTRITVDVSTRVAGDLKATAHRMRDELPGAPHVAVGQVMAALAALVHEDPEVSDRVIAYLRKRVVQ